MLAKALEIRDRHTFIPALAVSMEPDGETWHHDYEQRRYLLARAGYNLLAPPLILLTRLNGGGFAYYDPYDWGDRTWTVAHDYIQKHWTLLADGDVIDVEYILGETSAKKVSEREEVFDQ